MKIISKGNIVKRTRIREEEEDDDEDEKRPRIADEQVSGCGGTSACVEECFQSPLGCLSFANGSSFEECRWMAAG